MTAADPSTVTAWVAFSAGGDAIRPVSAELTIDRTWSPYAQASVVVPYEHGLLTAIDPRNGWPRLSLTLRREYYAAAHLSELGTLWAGQTLDTLGTRYTGKTLDKVAAEFAVRWTPDDGFDPPAPDERVADLLIRGLSVDHKSGLMTITATSDELRAQRRHVDALLPAQNAQDRVWAILAAAGVPVMAAAFDAGLASTMLPDAVLPAASSAWDAIAAAAAAAGQVVWCDERRTWRSAPSIATPTEEGRTLARATAASEVIDVDSGWADGLIVKTTATVTTTVSGTPVTGSQVLTTTDGNVFAEHVAVQSQTLEGTYAAGTVPVPTLAQMDWRLYALRRAGRVLHVTAPIDLTLHPGLWLHTDAPSLPQLAGGVTAITWRVPDDTCDITLSGVEDEVL